MYKVVQRFCDGEGGKPFPADKGGIVYEVGDTYPAEGIEQTDKHIKYLLDCDFRRKGPVIQEVEPSDAEKKAAEKAAKEAAAKAAAEKEAAEKAARENKAKEDK